MRPSYKIDRLLYLKKPHKEGVGRKRGSNIKIIDLLSYRCNNNQHTQCAKLDCLCDCHNYLIKN